MTKPQQTPSQPPPPWSGIGDALRSWRNEKKKTLRELADDSKRVDPEGRGVQAAQISRIENGAIPDAREIFLLANALALKPEDLLRPKLTPWFVLRKEQIDERLAQVESGIVQSTRLNNRHKHMMERKFYRYIPLETENALEHERQGDLQPGMRAYVFEVARATRKEVIAGLDSHEGEEIVLVTEGELEFWYAQDQKEHARAISLKVGDVIHYSSNLLHGYRAGGTGDTAKAIFVFAEPVLPTPPQATTDPSLEMKGAEDETPSHSN
jgi:transcriptional regulator with XRE-family HTH domain